MFDRFKNILKSKSSAGLEIIILPDGSYELNLVVLKKQKSSLVTEKQSEGLSAFKEAAALIGSEIPIIIIINGKGVIHRKVDVHENDSSTMLLNKILPNASANEFVIQKTVLNSTQAFISVIRLNSLTEILNQLITNKMTSIAGCSLGPFAINDLLPLISTDAINNENIVIGNYQLQVREQQITEINTATLSDNKNIVVGNESIPEKSLIAFATALSYFTGNDNGILNSIQVNNLKEEFYQKQKFEVRGWAVLAVTFLILMINYFVFNNYWSKNNAMNAQLTLTQSALQRYEKLKTEFAQKKEFLEQNGLLDHSRTSYYADQLAGNLPASIQWTGLNIHPLKKKKASDETETLFFENKLISISGNCQRSTDLNDWMKEIKKQTWVKDVTLVDYKQENAKEDGVFLMEISSK
jgi:Tfp pilus assembly protein PilN